MVINNNITFRRKHRHVWFGVLCLVLITAAVAAVGLYPTQIDDAMSTESEYNFALNGGEYDNETSDDLGVLIAKINLSTDDKFIITVYNDAIIFGYTLNKDKELTLISSSDKALTLTITEKKRHFTVYGTLALENIKLKGSTNGGGIDVGSSGTLVMNKGAEIQSCKSISTHGGAVNNYGTFTMTGGTFSGNTSTYGGAVSNYGSESIFKMTGGTFSGNTSTYGGAVFNSGTFTMTGGTFSGNTSSFGGAVFNNGSESIFKMTGGTFSGNTSTHGGVVSNNGTFTMTGGTFSGNDAYYGGAVSNTGAFTMTGDAVISNNKAKYYYGGVYNSGTFTMNDGEISNNTAQDEGGGVYNSGTFTMNDGKISNNTASREGGGVYNRGAFNMNGGEIGDRNKASNGGGVYNVGQMYMEFDESFNELYFYIVATFIMDGGEISNNIASKEGGGVYISSDDTFEMHNGKISGNSADGNGGGVYNRGTFIMNGGEIGDRNKASNGGGVYNVGVLTAEYDEWENVSYLYKIATLIMNGGEISNNTASNEGGGVYNADTFIMNGGEISNNTASNEGGGVYNEGASYRYYDESDNLSYLYTIATLTMSGGKISSNTAKLGGGIYNSISGTSDITGGKISCNTATGADGNGSGGGIYTADLTKLKVGNGVVFSGNKAPMLRTNDVIGDDPDTYTDNIGNVVLDDWAKAVHNALAYNNFDINYLGDSWVVSIHIEPNGGGTVAVTNNNAGKEYQILDKVGWFYLPPTAGSISLSASAVSENEFIQFIKTGTNEIISPDSVPITGNMSITAEFRLAYFVTPEADDGSEISSNEVVKVMQGENVTFEFSARPGYHITAVFVDGDEISPEELALGEYTFSNVLSNHTIRVESEADVGIGGGETGTGPGNGNGSGTSTGPGSDGGKGDIEDGNGNGSENVGSGPSLSESVSGGWSVLGMICATLAILTGMIAVAAGKDRFRTDNDEKRSRTGMTLRVTALVIGIVSAAAFFLTEDRSLSAAAFGEWTLLMFVLFLAALILTMVSFRFDEADG